MTAIMITDTAIPTGIRQLVQTLPRAETVSGATLRFRSGDYLCTAGLVLLAAWRQAMQRGARVEIDDRACNARVRRMLQDTGFAEVMTTGTQSPRERPADGLLSIGGRLSASAAVAEMLSRTTHRAPRRAPNETMAHALAEMADAVAAVEGKGTGYLLARALAGGQWLEIAVARQGQPVANPSLTVSREMIAGRGGTLASVIGDGMRTVSPTGDEHETLTTPWPGLFAAMVVNIDD